MQTHHVTNPDPIVLSSLARLHVSIVDVIEGYEAMVEKAEPSLRPIVEDLLQLHREHSEEIAHELSDRGAEFDDGGSIQGTLNSTVVSIRALFTDLDLSALSPALDGEERLLKAYDEALADIGEHELATSRQNGWSADLIAAGNQSALSLRRQRDQIVGKISKYRKLIA